MALVNQAKREINAKIVFIGPGLAGKATNLKHIYNKLKPEFRGSMKSMNVQDARMLFFDFTPPGDGNVEGFRVRFHVYTVSGNNVDQAAWKMVLKGVDGVVFVADSQPQRREANRETLESLAGYLKGYGQSLSSIPVVFQYNKSDITDAQELSQLERELNPSRLPSFKASSQSGEGVLQTLLTLVKTVLNGMRSKGLEGIAGGETLQGMVETPAAPPAPPAGQPAAGVRPQAEQPAPEPLKPEPLQAVPVRAEAPVTAAPQSQGAVAQEPVAPQGSGGEAGFGEAAFGEVGLGEVRHGRRGLGEAAFPGGAQESLTLELSGAPQIAGPDLIRVPLTIRSGSQSKSVLLTLALSLGEG